MIKKENKIEWKEVDGEAILFDEKKNEFFVLNETGTFIWKKINGKNTEKEISSMLAKKYNKPEEKILADTKELIKKLHSMKFIKK
ncbi:MAG: PqqD family protein [archaeon]